MMIEEKKTLDYYNRSRKKLDNAQNPIKIKK